MSELTKCNRCNLRQMERRAAERGATVILELVTVAPLAGWTSARYSDNEEPMTFFQRVPEECVC